MDRTLIPRYGEQEINRNERQGLNLILLRVCLQRMASVKKWEIKISQLLNDKTFAATEVDL